MKPVLRLVSLRATVQTLQMDPTLIINEKTGPDYVCFCLMRTSEGWRCLVVCFVLTL